MDSEALVILYGLPIDPHTDHKARPSNAYVYLERSLPTRLCIQLETGGALYVDFKHLEGDIAPGH